MDAVIVFNTELSGLYEQRPPISKAKMASITRTAMKAIKFYKHVVQSVEKFILKCKAEYKVPGLYVIDSIVRQSRHQFGAEKDVFAPRFARNMQNTFANLFRCAAEDKSKIIRVLNLWQKNSVFAPEVIQPLFDLADPNHIIYQNQPPLDSSSNGMNLNSSMNQESPPPNMDDGHTMSSDTSGPMAIPTASQLDSSTIRQLQQLQQLLIRQTGSENMGASSSSTAQDSVKFNKKVLDYDYGDEEDEDNDNRTMTPRNQNNLLSESNSIAQLLNDPNVLRQLQNLQKLKQQEEKQSKLTEMRLQEEAFEKHLATVLKKLPFANECDLSRQPADQNQIFGMPSALSLMQQNNLAGPSDQIEPEIELVSDDGKVEVINLDGNSRSPSMDRDRYNKRRRSRSRSRDRSGRSRRRSRTRSPRSRRRSRDRDRGKDKDKERTREMEREYERERRRKGLHDIKKEHLSVCSTTLWVGHLSKLVQQEELSDTFAKYGDIISIDMIIPRGCAFLVMNRRQDAYKAMSSLKNYKLQGRPIMISWAAGKGVKGKEWKDYWDLDTGISYIPYNKLSNSTDFESLEEGGMFDEDSMPAWLKEKLKSSAQKKDPLLPMDPSQMFQMNMTGRVDTTQPPPSGQMIPGMQMVPPFMGPVPRLMTPMGLMAPNLVPGLSIGVPPPTMMIPTGAILPPIPMDKSVPPPSSTGNQPAFMNHFPPMPPHQMSHLPPVSIPSNSDDHMDIEMDDEPSTKVVSSSTNVSMFNRPPPQMFDQSMPPIPANMTQSYNKDHNDRERRQGHDRRSNSRDRRSNERELRGRDRDRDRDNRRSDRNFRNGSNSRWPDERSRSRDDDNSFRDSRRGSRDRNDRNERDKSLQDRLRDMANDGNRNEYNRRNETGDGMPWRDGPQMSGNFQGNFMDQNVRNIRPMNMGPTPLEDIRLAPMVMDNIRGPPPGMGHRGDFNRSDEFDNRRGGPHREFFGPNRFGGPMIRGGPPPPFGPRMVNTPLFMRGQRPPGPGFPERPFFDRAGGFDERGAPRNPRNVENRRDDSVNRPAWNAAAKDEDRVPANNSEQNESKDKKASRWGNSSPKSIVSEEENWDDEIERKNDDNSPIVPLPQTEPIDDDSDVDFDDGAAAAALTEKSAQSEISVADSRNENVETVDEPQHSVPLQQQSVDVKQNIPERFDIFDDNETAATKQPQPTAFNNSDDDKDTETSENRNESAECNTTPLYDEPEEKKHSTEKDEQHDVETNSESTNENKPEAELPTVPGVDD
ncbi:SR-related and CTD-associated factor 4 isoform X2 [Bradysia coprophila]|uniref:SR-related and CTD-associated factor 4 isoform X2 n=1 Tax=Bradysia coprophila TaxID=38358 RepID=UPI00187DA030|nr:SR-related and CTD-associated factor 4 isoform X2 [Bradysia coprophila]